MHKCVCVFMKKRERGREKLDLNTIPGHLHKKKNFFPSDAIKECNKKSWAVFNWSSVIFTIYHFPDTHSTFGTNLQQLTLLYSIKLK